MQTSPTKATVAIWEGASPVVMAYVVDSDDDDVTQAGVASISYAIVNLRTQVVLSTGTLTIADVIYDTLQTGNGWTYPGNGYNFRWKIPGSSFPAGAGVYRVEIEISAGGDVLPLVFDVEVSKRYS